MNIATTALSGRSPYFLKTERIVFRSWTKDDLPLAQALWGDSNVTCYLGGPFSPDQVKEKLDQEIVTMRRYGIQYWPFFLLPKLEHIGCAGLRPRIPEERIYELGFHLRPAYWGRGLAQEAGRAVIRFAFETLGASALFAGHHPENLESRRILTKLGFVFTHEERYPPTDLMHPGYVLRRAEGPSRRFDSISR